MILNKLKTEDEKGILTIHAVIGMLPKSEKQIEEVADKLWVKYYGGRNDHIYKEGVKHFVWNLLEELEKNT